MQDTGSSDPPGSEKLPAFVTIHGLRVPALSFGDYRRMQVLMLRDAVRRRRSWRRSLIGMLASVILGGVGGLLASFWEVNAELWIVSLRNDWLLSLGGLGIFLGAVGLLVVGALAQLLIFRGRQERALRALHAASGEVLGEHDLLLGESGLLWRNASRTVLVPWSHITGVARAEGMVFLFADRISAFWLPEAVLAAQPDRGAVEALLRQRVPAFSAGASAKAPLPAS